MIGERITFAVDLATRDYNAEHYGIPATDLYAGVVLRWQTADGARYPVVRLDTGHEVVGPFS